MHRCLPSTKRWGLRGTNVVRQDTRPLDFQQQTTPAVLCTSAESLRLDVEGGKPFAATPTDTWKGSCMAPPTHGALAQKEGPRIKSVRLVALLATPATRSWVSREPHGLPGTRNCVAETIIAPDFTLVRTRWWSFCRLSEFPRSVKIRCVPREIGPVKPASVCGVFPRILCSEKKCRQDTRIARRMGRIFLRREVMQ